MTNDRDLETTVRAWLQESPPGPPDRRAVHARVIDRLPQTHQRRHWWPLEWNPFVEGATRSARTMGPRPRWRSMTMFGTTGLVAVSAAVALAGGLLFVSTNVTPDDGAFVPGADAPVSMEPAHFTGTVRGGGGFGDIEELDDRIIERNSTGYSTNAMSDSRLSGQGSSTSYLERILAEDLEYVTYSSRGELSNDGGAFQVSCSGAGTGGTGAADPNLGISLSCWYEGTGGYDGLTAFAVLTSSDVYDGEWEAEGWILPAEPPPSLE